MKKAKTKKRADSEVRDNLQDGLEDLLAEACNQFFKLEDVANFVSSGEVVEDEVVAGALLTTFTKRIAYISAKHPDVDQQKYLQSIYDAMSEFFVKIVKEYAEVLKTKGESNSTLQ